MIRSLNGIIEDVLERALVVSVSGIGYLVYTPHTSGFVVGKEIFLHTHLAVRENSLDVYGFLTPDELSMFQHLLTLPKIGPKSALQVMAQADIQLLMKAIYEGDAIYLSKMSGIGKKTAEKIVDGLKDTFVATGELTHSREATEDSDLVDALITLGYSQKDARDALAKLPPETTDTNARIKEALKLLSK